MKEHMQFWVRIYINLICVINVQRNGQTKGPRRSIKRGISLLPTFSFDRSAVDPKRCDTPLINLADSLHKIGITFRRRLILASSRILFLETIHLSMWLTSEFKCVVVRWFSCLNEMFKCGAADGYSKSFLVQKQKQCESENAFPQIEMNTFSRMRFLWIIKELTDKCHFM